MSSRATGLLVGGVLVFGVGLRVALTAATPARLAYDDHFTPIFKLLKDKHLPKPDECWECYQPPLFYVAAAAVYSSANELAGGPGMPPLRTKGGPAPSPSEQHADAVARKAVQCISTAAGCLTLLVCWGILRRLRPDAPRSAALGLAVVAVLPQHIYMSAMVTNDAITYFIASLAIYAALRAHPAGWRLRWWALTGALCGATVLGKAYGLVTVAAAWAVCAAALLAGAVRATRTRPTRGGDAAKREPPRKRGRLRTAARPPTATDDVTTAAALTPARAVRVFAVLVAATLAVGMWPAVRNMAIYGRPQIDNFQNFTTGMQSQPPGSVDAIEFFTFRYFSLLRCPWLHVSHLQSFWTELYGRFWFEYEGAITLRESPEWAALRNQALQQYRGWTRPAWDAMLDWGPADVPAKLRWVAVASYLAGLPLTLLVLAGAVSALRRWREFGASLLLLHWAVCLFVPLYQVLRIPYFAAMKSAFTLSALSSAAFFVLLAREALPGRWRMAATAIGWAAVAVVAAGDIAFAALCPSN